jgi:hypothetical protein
MELSKLSSKLAGNYCFVKSADWPRRQRHLTIHHDVAFEFEKQTTSEVISVGFRFP